MTICPGRKMVGMPRLGRKKTSILMFAICIMYLGTLKFGLDIIHDQYSTISPSTVNDHQTVTNSEITFPGVVMSTKSSCLPANKWKDMYDPAKFGGWTDFPLVTPHIEPTIPCEERALYMVVVVNSDATEDVHRSMRMAIRKTWGNSTNSHGYKWRLFFALGLSTNGAFNRQNHHEALQYNDVIIGNFSDTYRNIIIKTFMSHFWAYSKFSCEYVLKTDDDVYVRVSWLSDWLAKAGSPRRFYGGFISHCGVVDRDPPSKWYISREQYNETLWPPFAHGAFHVLSTDLLPAYFYYTQFHKPFHTDDAYLGVVARDLGVQAIDIPGFCYATSKIVCDLAKATAIAHNINPTKMMNLHNTYMSLRSAQYL